MKVPTRVRSLLTGVPPPRDDPPRPPLRGADVVILVLNWSNRVCTLECLESLERASLDGARVLVVDNGSTDGSVEAIRARFPRVDVLALPENRGFAGGNNAGVAHALAGGAGAVLLLNNDTRVAPDFLPLLLTVLNENPNAAAVSSAIMRLEAPDVLQEAWFDIYYGFGLIRRRGVNALPGEGYDFIRPVDAAIGCSLLIRAEALRELGSLDESYFAYHEEVDWCLRARKAGWQIFYQPYSRVWHHYSKSTDVARPRSSRRWNRTRGAELPNTLPVAWNPVRTYLGARNSIRFIRSHGRVILTLYFVASTLYNIPLEYLAVVLEREEELKLGLLTYRKALGWYCLEESGAPPEVLRGQQRATLGQWLRALVRAPLVLLHALPKEIRRARREGLTMQVEACARGHWDGLLGRPVPLEQLGLRPARVAVSERRTAGAAR
jgi:GT2 family glycosyltransferase